MLNFKRQTPDSGCLKYLECHVSVHMLYSMSISFLLLKAQVFENEVSFSVCFCLPLTNLSVRE